MLLEFLEHVIVDSKKFTEGNSVLRQNFQVTGGKAPQNRDQHAFFFFFVLEREGGGPRW